MAGLQYMPIEILEKIWEHVDDPHDIENFAWTSRTIRAVATKELRATGALLSRHHHNTGRFETLLAGGHEAATYLLLLLRLIAVDKWNAAYVRMLDLDTFVTIPWFAEDSRMLREQRERVFWDDRYQAWDFGRWAGLEMMTLSLILVLCPNISFLNIRTEFGSQLPNFLRLLRVVARTTKKQVVGLRKLNTVRICFDDSLVPTWLGKNPATDNIDGIAFALSVPSVHFLALTGVVYPCTRITDLDRMSSRSSNLTSLVLDGSVVDIQVLWTILSKTRSLRPFEYTSMITSYITIRFDAGEVCSALHAHARESIEILTLRNYNKRAYGVRTPFLHLLSDFRALKVLAISLQVLHSHIWWGQSTRLVFPPMMPTTIETLDIHTTGMENDRRLWLIVPSTINALVAAKGTIFPRLSKIILHADFLQLRRPFETLDCLEAQCQGVGIDLQYGLQ